MGKQQLQRYINNYPGPEIARAGTSLNLVISVTQVPSLMNPDKVIKYYTYLSDPGMIYWNYVNKPELKKEPIAIPEQNSEEVLKKTGELAVGVLVLWGIYEVAKWGIAALTAPATGGASLIGAGCMP